MTDKKLTDKEIIKHLKEMIEDPHYYEEGQILENVLDLLTRQQAENKRLGKEVDLVSIQFQDLQERYEEAQAEIESLKIFRGYAERRASDYKTMRDRYLNAKSEAVKEFAMKLKCGVPQETGVIRCSDIDNLVKEMVGENNDL